MFEENSAPKSDDPANTQSAPAPEPLLDDATVNRIKAKELEANAKSEASLVARGEKIEKARNLKDQIRLEQLRTIPVKQRTRNEQKEFDKLYSRQRRAKERGESVDIASSITSREQFWTLNRTTADQRKIGAWKERQERVFDILAWLDRVDTCEETPELCCEDFASIEEGAGDLIADVKANGVTPLGYIKRNQDIPTDWSTGVRNGKTYWQDSKLLQMLCEESASMMTWTKYGLLTALPDNRVISFLTLHCDWEWLRAAELCGIRINHLNEASYR